MRVLIVDDSPLCRELIKGALATDPDIEVVGTADNGEDAVAKALALKPAVITMDVAMPGVDGLLATDRIMGENPTPILVLTGDPRSQSPDLTHRALAAGALALRVKPALDAGPEAWNLAKEIKLLSTVKVIRHLRGAKRPAYSDIPGADAAGPVTMGVVVVVSSTGGPQVLQRLVHGLPANFPVPIVIVQHINPAFSEALVSWLARGVQVRVKSAVDGDLLSPNTVLVAPAGSHVVVTQRGRLALRPGRPNELQVPSGTMLMETAAKNYGRRTLGVVLTGMGDDGVEGLAAIRAAGGKTVAQSQESCVVFGMPAAAIERGVVDHIVHADELAQALTKMVRGQEPSAS